MNLLNHVAEFTEAGGQIDLPVEPDIAQQQIVISVAITVLVFPRTCCRGSSPCTPREIVPSNVVVPHSGWA